MTRVLLYNRRQNETDEKKVVLQKTNFTSQMSAASSETRHFFASFSLFLFAFLSVICVGPLLHHTNRTNAHCINRHNHAIYTDFSSAASFRCKIATEIHFVDRMQRFRLTFILHLLGCCLVEDDFFASFQYPKLENVLECASNK